MFESTPIANPLFSAKLRLARAHEHLDDLEAKIDKWFAQKPYTQLVELDPGGVHAIHKVQVTKLFPTNWCMLATEIVEHLRASLDHAVFATRTKDPTLYAAFPFAKTADDLDNRIKGSAKDTPPEIQTLLRTFNCFSGGNDLLYLLNDLCNASKHSLIMLVAGATQFGRIKTTAEGIGENVQILDPLIWDREKNEIPYARTRRGFDFDHEGVIQVYVAVRHSDGVSPIPATDVFDRMLVECERVVSAIEAEAERLGLFSD